MPSAERETVVCLECLAEDNEAGRAPYVRTAWTHPLAVICPTHGRVLAPSRYPFSFHMERKGHIKNEPLRRQVGFHGRTTHSP
ncbi:TniQ family protein [Phenylobacterium sp. 58.2.17]|uniref:TniQ family protein n=1 Tax=Phenylobacterium sp. 58.2.17 TaxID=2969306 RepID=UPI003A5BB14B